MGVGPLVEATTLVVPETVALLAGEVKETLRPEGGGGVGAGGGGLGGVEPEVAEMTKGSWTVQAPPYQLVDLKASEVVPAGTGV